MLTVNCVRHTKFSVIVILDKWIETAGVHFRLQKYPRVGQIFGVHFHNADVLPIDGRVE